MKEENDGEEEISEWSDKSIFEKLDLLVDYKRKLTGSFIKLLSQLDKRRSYLRLGHSSLYDYIVKHLKLTESEAFLFMITSRVYNINSFFYPLILTGEHNLSTVKSLSPYFLDKKYELNSLDQNEIVNLSKDVSWKEVEYKIEFYLKKKYSMIPENKNIFQDREGELVVRPHWNSNEKTGHDQKKVDEIRSLNQVYIPRIKLRKMWIEIGYMESQKIDKVKSYLSYLYPQGISLSELLMELVDQYIQNKENKEKEVHLLNEVSLNKLKNYQSNKRFVPKGLKLLIYKKSEYRCEYIGSRGERCLSKWRLQIDHIEPLSKGGKTEFSNLRVLCANHNIWEAKKKLGDKFMEKSIGKSIEEKSIRKQ